MSEKTTAWIANFIGRHSDGCYCRLSEDFLGQSMAELADLARTDRDDEYANEIERLQAIVAAGSHLSEVVSTYLRAHDQHGHSRHIDMDMKNKAYHEAAKAGGK